MRYYRLPLLLLLLCSCAHAQTDSTATRPGIAFTEAPFAELLARARAENKPVFIDAYTTWCGPCKLMARKVFTDARVGQTYNERFINAKIDMEQGEGPELGMRYGVAAFPTYLFVDGNGELIHKGLGYQPREAFLELADAATGPRSLGALNRRYAAGDRDPQFVSDYATTLTELMERQRADTVVNNYLDGRADWSDPTTLELLVGSPGVPGDKRMIYLVEHADTVGAVVGTGTLMGKLQEVLVGTYGTEQQLRALPEPGDSALAAYYLRFAAPLRERLQRHYALMYYERMGQADDYVPAALAYYADYPSNEMSELNGAAWNVYEASDDPAALRTALGWAEQSVAIQPNYPNLDTLAWLYHKTGQDEMASKTAARAIHFAKAQGTDPGELHSLLR